MQKRMVKNAERIVSPDFIDSRWCSNFGMGSVDRPGSRACEVARRQQEKSQRSRSAGVRVVEARREC